MSGRYSSYPEYRPSELRWLGDLPSHWRLTPLKYLCSFTGGGTPSKEIQRYWTGGDIPWVSPKDMKTFRIRDTIDHLTDAAVKESATSFVEPGALLMVVRSGILAHNIPVAINDSRVTLNQDMKAMRFQSPWSARYLAYLVQGHTVALRTRWLKEGATVESIEQALLANEMVPNIDADERNTIVEFLDYETAKMDGLIEKQQQLIALLKEKRQAVISHAVTKGLNPDAPMRDSGVEWLGTVPRHWEVVPIKWVTTRVQTGTTPPTESERFYRDGSVPWYGPSSFGEPVSVGIPVKLIHESAIQEGKARQFRKGAILVVGIGATIGKSALAHMRCSANQQVTGLEFPDAILHPEYAALSLRRLEEVFRHRAQYTTMPIMNQQEIGAYHLAVPPIPEQLDIVNILNARLSQVDVIVQQAADMASLLQERRTALISAAVTGKIDVRGWKPPAAASDGQTPAHNE